MADHTTPLRFTSSGIEVGDVLISRDDMDRWLAQYADKPSCYRLISAAEAGIDRNIIADIPHLTAPNDSGLRRLLRDMEQAS